MSTTTIESVGPVPAAAQYLCWVQRSLQRHGWSATAADGRDTSGYRRQVGDFNLNYSPSAGDRVEPATQDALVRLNHVDANYTAWVQAALIRAGVLDAAAIRGEPIMDQAGSATRRAVLRLQQQQFKKDGGLKPDGWVGPKTELVLRKFSRGDPPDRNGHPLRCPGASPKPPVKPKPERPSLIDLTRAAAVQALGRDDDEREQLACLRDFLVAGLAGQSVDDRYRTFRLYDGFGRERSCTERVHFESLEMVVKPQRALANYRRLCAAARTPAEAARCIALVHRAVFCHTNALLRWSRLAGSFADARLRDYRECTWLLELHAASRRSSPRSVYSCFKSLLDYIEPCL